MEALKTIIYICSECGKKYKTTQQSFDKRNKDSIMVCNNCKRLNYNTKETIKWKYQ